MNYTEIKDVSVAFTNRSDTDVMSNLDSFLRLAESRVARGMRNRNMFATDSSPLVDDNYLYDLPPDFREMRSCHIEPTIGDKISLDMVNPQQSREADGQEQYDGKKYYFSLEGNSIRITPYIGDGSLLILYYQDVPDLTALAPNNWLSDNDPDIYINAMCSEIYTFVKDFDSAKVWEGKLNKSLDDMSQEDTSSRWSGPPLVTKIA